MDYNQRDPDRASNRQREHSRLVNAQSVAAYDGVTHMYDFTSDPIEGEVCSALACYKHALIDTDYNGVLHRLLCWAGDNDARARAATLDRAEHHARSVVGKSPDHRAALERIVRRQPDHVAEQDKFLALLDGYVDA